ncbi:MAG TPA: hypothetical protein VM582_08635, partial [Candidatus Thermoplasmatota archaeon]|nr:hypothetical protein [Candidatus Thermoplasmatota archaeon]
MLRAVLMVLLLALPVAGAQWRAVGGLEPDTPEDVEHGRMFDRPLPGRVYFQAFVALPETSSNPNVALLGTRVLPAPAAHHRALLGIWTDCNGDGYIGNAESALQDYSARLLLDSARCPAEVYRGFPIHNDGQWVSELLMIGMVDPCEHEPERAVRDACGVDAFAPNERVFYVDHTFVWGDLGAPGSIPRAECILAPLPRGT